MFPARYYAVRQFAPRYFPKVGAERVAIGGNRRGGFMKNLGRGMNR